MITWSPAGGSVSGGFVELKPHSEMLEFGTKPEGYGLALILASLLCLLIWSGGNKWSQTTTAAAGWFCLHAFSIDGVDFIL